MPRRHDCRACCHGAKQYSAHTKTWYCRRHEGICRIHCICYLKDDGCPKCAYDGPDYEEDKKEPPSDDDDGEDRPTKSERRASEAAAKHAAAKEKKVEWRKNEKESINQAKDDNKKACDQEFSMREIYFHAVELLRDIANGGDHEVWIVYLIM